MINESQYIISTVIVGENLSRWQLGGLIDSHKLVTKKLKQYEKVIQKANIILFSTSKGC